MNCKIFNQAVYLNNSYDTNTDTQFYSTNFNKSHNISKYKNKNYTYRRLKSAATIPTPRAVRARKFRPQQTRLKCSTRVPISNVPPYQIAFSPSPPLVLSWNASEIPAPLLSFPPSSLRGMKRIYSPISHAYQKIENQGAQRMPVVETRNRSIGEEHHEVSYCSRHTSCQRDTVNVGYETNILIKIFHLSVFLKYRCRTHFFQINSDHGLPQERLPLLI